MSTKSARRSKSACAEEKAQVRLENLLEIAKENVNKKIFERLSAYVVELMKEYKETKIGLFEGKRVHTRPVYETNQADISSLGKKRGKVS